MARKSGDGLPVASLIGRCLFAPILLPFQWLFAQFDIIRFIEKICKRYGKESPFKISANIHAHPIVEMIDDIATTVAPSTPVVPEQRINI